MTRGAEALVTHTWRGSSTREVYADFNDLTLQITTDALFGFKPSNPESNKVTGNVPTFLSFDAFLFLSLIGLS